MQTEYEFAERRLNRTDESIGLFGHTVVRCQLAKTVAESRRSLTSRKPTREEYNNEKVVHDFSKVRLTGPNGEDEAGYQTEAETLVYVQQCEAH